MAFTRKMLYAANRNFAYYLIRLMRESGAYLDIGCGQDSPIKNIENKSYCVGLDGFKPYLLESKKKRIHNDYVLASFNNLCFKDCSFENVVLFDVIEHMKKNQGNHMIDEVCRFAKNKVLILTPNGFRKQNAFDNNKYQIHLSGWAIDELKRKGFKIRGINGFKGFKKEENKLKINHPFFQLLVDFSEVFAFRIPEMAYQLLAVKELKHALTNS